MQSQSFLRAEADYLTPPEGPDYELLREEWHDTIKIKKIARELASSLLDTWADAHFPPDPVATTAWQDAFAAALAPMLAKMDPDEVGDLGALMMLNDGFEIFVENALNEVYEGPDPDRGRDE